MYSVPQVIKVVKDQHDLPKRLSHNDIYIVTKDYDLGLENYDTDVGLDLKCIEDVHIYPNSYSHPIDLGVKIAFPVGYGVFLFPRSSIWKAGLILSNSVGVTDPEYRNSMKAVFYNQTDDDIKLEKFSRLVQLVIVPVLPLHKTHAISHDNITVYYIKNKAIYDKWHEIIPSNRGTKGLGSTGS